MSLLTSTTDRIVADLGDEAAVAIAAARELTDHEMRPVPPGGADRAQWEAALDERLRRLAVKCLPTASAKQTAEWRSTMLEALSDLPAMIALTAAKKAIHRPARFIGDIEPAIREIAAEMIERRETRLAGLARMETEIARTMNAAPVLNAPDDDRVITAAEIRAMKPEFRSMGLKAGFITDEQVAAALSSGYVPEVKEAA